jgi:hypothetical protein
MPLVGRATNGTAQSDAFMEHALVVLVVPPIAIILACVVYTVAHALAGPPGRRRDEL